MAKKILKYAIGVGAALAIFLAIYGFTVIANTPKIDPDNIYDYLSESSVLLDDEGKVIDSVYIDSGNRTNIDYKDMPQDLVNAVVSIEDKTFWKHNGFNFWRIGGAIKDSIFSGGGISGTSTVTQQLARNVYLSETKSVRSLGRKISEAYYTVILESHLEKEEIIEAYLNTIYFGNNAYGVQSAATAYFNKDAKDLDLTECVSLAALPKAPDAYALVKKKDASEGTTGLSEDQVVVYENSDYIFYYNGDVSKNRRDTTINFMEDNGYITAKEAKATKADKLVDHLDVSASGASSGTSYFVDYLIEQVSADLMEKYNYTEQEAKEKIYSGGLKIHTTLNSKAQKAVETAFADNSNFPSITGLSYDSNGNIKNGSGGVSLYKYGNYFNENDEFVLEKDEYKTKNGDLVLLKGKRLNFYKTTVNGETDYSVEFKDMFKMEDGALYSIQGGVILIPQNYKTLDKDANLVIDKAFFDDDTLPSSFFEKDGNTYKVPKTCYQLRSSVRQPQAAMVITDYKTGGIKAMVGGRDISGRKLYNRAINPRSPGSSIKPLAVYSSALQQGYEAAQKGKPMTFKEFDDKQNTEYYGDYWTAASGINDQPIKVNGRDWPRNVTGTYTGEMSMRTALENSVNTVSVRIFQQVGDDYAIEQLKKFGISTVVEDGEVNDKNASALALGGMSRGISPLEMSAAYGTIANKGERVDSITYTKVVDKKGETLVKTKPEKTEVLDKGVAYVTQSMLQSTVSNHITVAKVSGQPTAGKTGTTNDVKDIWFCGFTPQYSAAIWIGNDINMEIGADSFRAARLWSKIMSQATSGMGGSLASQPSNVVNQDGEVFVKGTEVGVRFNPSLAYSAQKVLEEKQKEYIDKGGILQADGSILMPDGSKVTIKWADENNSELEITTTPGTTTPGTTVPGTTTPGTTAPGATTPGTTTPGTTTPGAATPTTPPAQTDPNAGSGTQTQTTE